MVNFADVHDAGARIETKNGLTPQTIEAGGGNDNSEQNGIAIDRFAPDDIFRSLKVSIPYSVNIATTGENCVLSFNLQHSSVSSAGWSDYDDKDGSTSNSVTLTTGSANDGVLQADFDLGGAKRWVRAQVTANFSNDTTGTDDIDLGVVHVLAGGDTPQS